MSNYRYSETIDRAICQFAASICKTIGLPANWQIGLSQLRPDKEEQWEAGAFASIDPVPHRHVATIKVCEDFLQIGHREMLGCLIHECCHLFFQETRQAIEDLETSRALSIGEQNALNLRTGHAEELAVDAMSEAWAEVMWEWPDTQKFLNKITTQVERSVP